MSNEKDARDGYTKSPSLFATLSVISGLFFYYVETYKPELIPFESLGFIGNGLLYLREKHWNVLDIGFKIAVGLHLLEGCYALYLSRKKNLPFSQQLFWFIQTTIIGFPSTVLIMAYKPRKD